MAKKTPKKSGKKHHATPKPAKVHANTNVHGLSRDIPEHVRRQVRQECFFGCVVCGALPTDYDHFDPEFVDALSHNPKKIALLCTQCHREKTAGRLATALVAQKRADPFNKSNAALWSPKLGPGLVRFKFGGNVITGNSAGLSINGSPVLSVTRPPGGGIWRLAGRLVAHGKEVLRFDDNATIASSGVWDVELAGTRLAIRCERNGEPDVVAEIVFDAKAGEVHIERLRMSLKDDHRLVLTANGVTIGRGENPPFLNVGGNVMEGAGDTPFLCVGAPLARGQRAPADTMQINLPELGTYDEWIR